MNQTYTAIGITHAEGPWLTLQPSVPVLGPHDVWVAVQAAAVNPVDAKLKASLSASNTTPKVLGYDACGRIAAVGTAVQGLAVGDRVFYAGDVRAPGSFANYQRVDAALVARAPSRCSDLEAAALPLVSLTAWEALFDRLRISQQDVGKTLLIVNGAGGVGSIAIQLAKQLAGLQVVATASRPESQAWCLQMGADVVIDHHTLAESYVQSGMPAPDFILCLADTDTYFATLCDLIAPQGLIALTVTSVQPQHLEPLKRKSAGVVWEFMFTRPSLERKAAQQQGQILQQIADFFDQGVGKTILQQVLPPLSVESIAQAFSAIESAKTIGKIAIPIEGDYTIEALRP